MKIMAFATALTLALGALTLPFSESGYNLPTKLLLPHRPVRTILNMTAQIFLLPIACLTERSCLTEKGSLTMTLYWHIRLLPVIGCLNKRRKK